MVAGIVLTALGLKTTIGHFDDHLHAVPAFALLGGVADLPARPGRLPLPPRPHDQPRSACCSADRPADPGPGRDRGPGAGRGRRRQRPALGDDRLRDPPLRRRPPRGAPTRRQPKPRPSAGSGRSNSCSSAGDRRSRGRPVSVPQLARPTLTSSELAGSTKEAIAETMKRTEPSWLTTTIHQPSSRGPEGATAVADLDDRQVAGDQEERAADHVGGPDEAVLGAGAQAGDERVDEVDREDEGADEEDGGAEPLDPLAAPAPTSARARPGRRRRPSCAAR